MRTDYYNKHFVGEKFVQLTKALSMIEHAPLDHVSKFCGVAKAVIVRAARETGRVDFIKNQKKYDMMVDDFYDSLTPPPLPNETREERTDRINNAITDYQGACDHRQYHVRCSRCMKILGSEVNHYYMEKIMDAVHQTVDEMIDLEGHSDQLHQFGKKLIGNIYKAKIVELPNEL